MLLTQTKLYPPVKGKSRTEDRQERGNKWLSLEYLEWEEDAGHDEVGRVLRPVGLQGGTTSVFIV